MSIKKILKFYLVITLMLTVFAAVSYSDEFKRYMSYSTSVFGYKYNETKPYSAAYNTKEISKNSDSKKIYYKENPYNLVFSISNDASKSMVSPGTQGAEIMTINFKTFGEAMVLRNLTFKIAGADGNGIKAAYLVSDGITISTANISNKYLDFLNIAHKIEKNNSSSVKIILDLAGNFKIGNRFRLDIETPEDIDIEMEDGLYSVNGYYPMKGEYLTISKTNLPKTK